MYGFHNRGEFTPPEWAGKLKAYYWHIRVEGRDKVKKRRYYRYIEKEKLLLAERGIDQILIKAVCRYLIKLDSSTGFRMSQLQNNQPIQLKLDFM